MSKKRLALHAASLSLLSVPNLTYLGINFDILKEANAVALTMTALLILSVVGLGALTHLKVNKGIYVTLIGIFVLALSNIAYIAAIALIIEGGCIAVDGYVLIPAIQRQKVKELKSRGESVIYTTEVK